jgi:hypothetical protein
MLPGMMEEEMDYCIALLEGKAPTPPDLPWPAGEGEMPSSFDMFCNVMTKKQAEEFKKCVAIILNNQAKERRKQERARRREAGEEVSESEDEWANVSYNEPVNNTWEFQDASAAYAKTAERNEDAGATKKARAKAYAEAKEKTGTEAGAPAQDEDGSPAEDADDSGAEASADQDEDSADQDEDEEYGSDYEELLISSDDDGNPRLPPVPRWPDGLYPDPGPPRRRLSRREHPLLDPKILAELPEELREVALHPVLIGHAASLTPY